MKNKFPQSFPSVPSEHDNEQSSSYLNENSRRDFQQSQFLRQQNTNNQHQQLTNNKQLLQIEFQNLDIDPIINKNGDRFIFQQTQGSQMIADQFQNTSKQFKNIQCYQSQVWVDVFYAKKNIMHLLQQRNDICQMYRLNSKSLKLINTNSLKKRVFSDLQIAQYIQELFQQSPSYHEYDNMSFTIIHQINSVIQKYYVFLGTDNKFVPQCKSCSVSAYLIVNVQFIEKDKISNPSTLSNANIKKLATLKGKIFCSNTKCKRKLLGQFVISHHQKAHKHVPIIHSHQKNTYHTAFMTEQRSLNNNYKRKTELNPKQKLELNQKQKLKIKKAALKAIL